MKTCIGADCNRKHVAKGLCRLHYARWMKYHDFDKVFAQDFNRGANSPHYKHIIKSVEGFKALRFKEMPSRSLIR